MKDFDETLFGSKQNAPFNKKMKIHDFCERMVRVKLSRSKNSFAERFARRLFFGKNVVKTFFFGALSSCNRHK